MAIDSNRRQVLQGALAAASLFSTRAFGGEPRLWDVVVVGGGLAGLNAAMLLEAQGLKVQVVEASDRVGGRLRTGRQGDYQAELGGSEVGPGYGRIRDMVERLGVGLHTNGGKTLPFALGFNGELLQPDAWASSPHNMTHGAERGIAPYLIQNRLFFDRVPFTDPGDWLAAANLQYDVSAAEYLRAQGVSEAAIRLCDIDVNAPNMAAVSALSIFRDLVRIKVEGFTDPTKPQYGANASLTRAYIKGGSDMLPRAMAATLKQPVRLNAPVVAIEQTDREVETRLADGTRLRSRFLVMAAPFSAVRRIRFLPGLPPVQDNAIQGALYSATTQFHFRIKKPYWESDGLNGSLYTDARFERAFVNAAGAGPHGTLTVWMNGDGATRLDGMPLEVQKDYVIAEMVKLRPAMADALDYVFGYSWERNPFVGGNKHVFGAGQIRSFAADMGKPAGRIHFAGEHLRKLEAGMESAMETGEVAAFEILDRV
ncbi:MAG: hypothetical protein CFE37_03800 [Alphaproteobacteria bacterium PA4]|nr:MAG: hypothetical protein CFE37_03800 [Alphaproteobacteria bacterium PA4]